jgi:hypothetical protein
MKSSGTRYAGTHQLTNLISLFKRIAKKSRCLPPKNVEIVFVGGIVSAYLRKTIFLITMSFVVFMRNILHTYKDSKNFFKILRSN